MLGEKAAHTILDKYFAEGPHRASEILRQERDDCLSLHHQCRFRVTGDIVVNNINHYAQKLIRYRIIENVPE